MPLSVALLVLFAGVLHAVWNAVASRAEDQVVTLILIGAVEAIIAIPALLLIGMPRRAAVAFAVASAIVHVAYNVALLRSYRLGGFGHVYPLARGSSVLLIALSAWLIAGERLDRTQIAGVGLVIVGLLAIVVADGLPAASDRPAVIAALLTGATIATYSVLDGLGARHSGAPLRYVALLCVLQGPMIVAAGLTAPARRAPRPRLSMRVARPGLIAGVLSVLAYGLVIWAQTRAPLALVSALRETSVISAALISTFVFDEPFARRRIPAAVVIAAGIVLAAA